MNAPLSRPAEAPASSPAEDDATGGRERILPPTHSLVDERGLFAIGLRTHPFERVNPLDVKPRHIPLPRAIVRLGLKEWQHFAICDGRYYVSVALFDAKRIALVQLIVYDRLERRLVEYEKRTLTPFMQLPNELWADEASYEGGGFSVRFENRLREGRHLLHIRAPANDSRPTLKLEIELDEPLDRVEPMVVALPFRRGRAMYSHKAVLTARGHIELGETHHTFQDSEAYGLIDIHKGYYPFVMKWHWATGAVVTPKGLVGFNFTDNQVIDQSRFNENGLWVDGKLSPLGPARFEFDPGDHLAPWRIRDDEGRVDLRFEPQTIRKVDINLLVLRSKYRGPFGRFSGTIRDHRGEAHCLDDAFGMCEDFYLRA